MKIAAALLVVLMACSRASAADLFVDQINGGDANDGLSWATARATVASALATAAASPEPDVISVAAGRYLEQLVIPADTTLLGGFPAGGGMRDAAANVTTLDGGRTVAPVVHFPPGSDRTVLDGFLVRGGLGADQSIGGGILVEDAAPLIQGNVIEENAACWGSGIALVYSGASTFARVVANVIQRNLGHLPGTRTGCGGGRISQGGGVFISAPPGMDLGLILSGNRILANAAGSGGGVSFQGQGAMEHDVVDQNYYSGIYLSGGPINLFNVAVTANRYSGITAGCAGTYGFDNLTLAANDFGGIRSSGGGSGDLRVENSILWRNSAEVTWYCGGSPPSIVSSLVEGGFVGGVGIIDADPLFVPGPNGDYYLSQASAGQPSTSPAVDAGSQPSLNVGLDQRTTATDSTADGGMVDLGYHPTRVLTLTVLRGTVASGLTLHRTLASLPFVDDPGTLSDPGLPLLFYEVAGAVNDIAVDKDIANDAVRLVFR